MIVDLPNTGTRDVAKRLVTLRHDMGAVALGRVMTLVVDVEDSRADEAIEAATEATRQSPSRIIVLVHGTRRGANRLDAQIRLGGDAGASEIVVLRMHGKLTDHGRAVVTPLVLADSPIVVWWPGAAPSDVGKSPLGRLSQRRITDAQTARNPRTTLNRMAKAYVPGDTDLSWARITRWRALLAAALDQAPYESVTDVTVSGASDSVSSDLLAAWLAVRLRCPVKRARTPAGSDIVSVRMERESGPIDVVRTSPTLATMSQPGQPVRRVSLVPPFTAQAMAEELRRLDRDDTYEEALLKGLKLVSTTSLTGSEAVRTDEAPDVDEARRAGESARRAGAQLTGSAMVEAEPDEAASEEQVKEAAARKLDAKKAERSEDRPRAPRRTTTTSGAKAAAKQSTGKKAAAKRSAAKKSAAKRSTAKKSAAKKAATRRDTAAPEASS